VLPEQSRRTRTEQPEGVVYGCWFYMLFPPFSSGSGVFLNVGRTLVLPNKPTLHGLCRKQLKMERFDRYPPELGSLPAQLVRTPPPDMLARQSDNHLAACLERLGYDTAQLRHESILLFAAPQCTIPGQRQLAGACPPRPTVLRTGRNASLACACSDAPTGGRRRGPWVQMNCNGGSAPLGASAGAPFPASSLELPAEERPVAEPAAKHQHHRAPRKWILELIRKHAAIIAARAGAPELASGNSTASAMDLQMQTLARKRAARAAARSSAPGPGPELLSNSNATVLADGNPWRSWNATSL
jgi:hypothetical protein